MNNTYVPELITLNFENFSDFKPNLTPRDIFMLGSFGGTYWREIYSSVTKKTYKNEYKKYSFLKNIDQNLLTRSWDNYDKSINFYKVKVGNTLEEWEDKNWITYHNPYGWIHWYCDFYNRNGSIEGRTQEQILEDERQIDRWKGIAGVKGRFKNRLINMINNKSAEYDDYSISPKIRQTLQHWGYQVTEKDL